ncbi:MAG TPA: hypothetical protein VFZ76_12915 [Anaerolineales bacterium]
MSRFKDTTWCDNCGGEIAWVPIVVGSQHYCCRDCLDGYRCECASLMDLDEERHIMDANVEMQSQIDFH